MPEADPRSGPRAFRGRDDPVAGLLRDSIVGITCFPDPLPKSGKRRSRRRWPRAKHTD